MLCKVVNGALGACAKSSSTFSLPHLRNKLLDIPEQDLRPLHRSKMPTSMMFPEPHQIPSRLDPRLRNRRQLLGEPREPQWLAQVPIWVLVRADDTRREELAVRVDGCWEAVCEVVEGYVGEDL